jgi:prepilin-type N-terminal cleavage/methylation domain-containing protein
MGADAMKGPGMDRKRILSWLRRQEGYNLIEVLIAVALLATVLVAIISLFVLGGRYVKSGKELSKATALGIDAMEEMRNLPFAEVYRVINGGCDLSTMTWSTHVRSGSSIPYGVPARTDYRGRTIPNSGWTWLTENASAAEDYGDVLVGWYNQTEEQFGGGLEGATVVKVDGFNDIAAGKTWGDGDTNFCQARYIRVRVRVEWQEGPRKRDVVFETLKF